MRSKFKVDFSVRNMSNMALLVAVHLVLCYVDKIIPEMPQGGTILSLSVIPIFLASYLMGPGYGVIVGLLASLLQMALGLITYYGPWSMVLDYLIPSMVLGLAAIIPALKFRKNINIESGILFSMVLRYTSNVLSGTLLFAAYAPEGMNPLIYSLGYNLPYNLITCIFAMIAVPFLCIPLHKAIRLSGV